MKRILAVILTIVMLLGVVMINTSADTTDIPGTVTLVTNEGSPLDVEGKVAQDGRTFIFTVRFDNFILIRGIDITIDAGEGDITNVETFNLPSAVEGLDEFDENYIYTRGKSAIRFVDLNITSKSRIVLTVDSPSATQTVTVTGKYADTGETLVPITTNPQDYEVMEYIEEKSLNVGTLEQNDTDLVHSGYFVPYGGVYTELENETTFTPKEADGSFQNIKSGSKYIAFKLPKANVRDKNNDIISQLTAFGVSQKFETSPEHTLDTSNKALKFGSYTTYDDFNSSKPYDEGKSETANDHGTMVFDGDWLSLKYYYIKQGNTVQQMVRAIFEQMTKLEQSGQLGSNIVDNPETRYHVTYTVPKWDDPTGEEKVSINVYKFPRVKYIWRDGTDWTDDAENAGKMEYAIRLHNIEPSTYTSVAYCLEDGKLPEQVQISHNVKSITVNSDWSFGEVVFE